MTTIEVPATSLVVLVGISSSGKSEFARRAFGPYEVVSSDECRGLVANDPNDQTVTTEAFSLLFDIVGRRLRAGLLTVVDATSIHPGDRKALVELARENHVLPSVIVLDVPLAEAKERHRIRLDRPFDESVLVRQHKALQKGIRHLGREGFRGVTVLREADEISAATVRRVPLRSDLRDEEGPFDLIGDVHGCLAELCELLGELGYRIDDEGTDAEHPQGRRAVFVGDLVDRGPDSVGVLRLVMGMVEAGHALCVPGNHEAKLVRALDGRDVKLTHGLDATMEQLQREPAEFRRAVRDFADGLVAHLVLDQGRLVVAHAGLKQEFHNRASARVRAFALYGDTTGETNEYGLPVRLPWAEEYRGDAAVVHGHVLTTELNWVNNTLCLDTGCVFGGSLSALRYPERETVQVPAHREWFAPTVPLPTAGQMPQREDGILRLDDLVGVDGVDTERMGRIRLDPDRAAAALETMSRFALPPEQLGYLPPTMAPAPTSREEGYLEHPTAAFAAYEGSAERVICQEKHMGSRAVVMLCRRGSAGPHGTGSYAYSRTGRRFFDSADGSLLASLSGAAETAGLFDQLDSDWVLLDGEILPWNLKADGLIREVYRPAAAAGENEIAALEQALRRTKVRGIDVPGADGALAAGPELEAFRKAFERYEGDVTRPQLAPFQVLASEGATWHHRPHSWHLEVADALADADPDAIRRTRRLIIDPRDQAQVAEGVEWWLQLTERGGEGMVVKPLANSITGRGGLDEKRVGSIQPGMKVRGREYLRMIYGHDYLAPVRLEKLRGRNLKHKQALALREYALGLESLKRWTAGEALHRVHLPVFAVLALESSPVDPRL